MNQQVIRCRQFERELQEILRSIDYDRLFILMDQHTVRCCFPLLESMAAIQPAIRIIVEAGDGHKNIESLAAVWKFLSDNQATRKSLLINLGGGMVTDLGGFAAATFKRGIRFVNIPTSLLGAVDAAVGGKTGINFNGLKNEVGTFTLAEAVLIETAFLKTLDHPNFLSGYAEMLKHALLSSRQEIYELLGFDMDNIDYERLKDLLFQSVMVKERIVEEDPSERGIRKALNLGHTFGHAFESFSYEINRPVLHGYAVAWGLVCELYLSHIRFNFDKTILLKLLYFIKEQYGWFLFDCNQYDRLYELMQHDKKNETGFVNFTLLKDVGDIRINQTASRAEIEETLDFFREN